FNCSTRTIQLSRRPDENTKLVWQHSSLGAFYDPVTDAFGLIGFVLERVNRRRGAIEHRDRIPARLAVAIRIGYDRTKKGIRLRTNLMGGAVIDSQCARSSTDIYTKGLP